MPTASTTFELDAERSLVASVSAFTEYPALESLTAPALRSVSQRHGVDFATALLFDRVRKSSRHAPFIDAIDRLESDTGHNNDSGSPLVGIVPAAFHREKPHTGADGQLVREEAIRLGLRCERVPTFSTGTLAENSRILLEWLAALGHEPVILVSLCKGGADVKFALAQPKAAARFKNVRAWVNLCGTLSGSPVAQWLLASKARFFAAWLLCKCQGHNFQFLRELEPGPAGPLAQPLELPPTTQLITLIGFPLQRHLSNSFMRQCHRRIAPHGPNDGGVLLADACALPGLLYPVWGADHYLRPEERGRRLIGSVLKHSLAGLTTDDPAMPRARTEQPFQVCGTGAGV